MLLIVGLGNIGKEYEGTRHNVGFDVIDALHKHINAEPWKEEKKYEACIAHASIDGKKVMLVKPTTYMNCSGRSVQSIVHFYKIDVPLQILIITDDIDIPLGTIRLRSSGGPGTHNGLKSIVEIYGEQFHRLRIGIGPKDARMDLADFVLSRMTKEANTIINTIMNNIINDIMKWIDSR